MCREKSPCPVLPHAFVIFGPSFRYRGVLGGLFDSGGSFVVERFSQRRSLGLSKKRRALQSSENITTRSVS